MELFTPVTRFHWLYMEIIWHIMMLITVQTEADHEKHSVNHRSKFIINLPELHHSVNQMTKQTDNEAITNIHHSSIRSER